MNWKNGQKLVCISEQEWSVGFGPKKDEIVTVAGFEVGFYTGREIVLLEEYPHYGAGYYPEYFRPLLGDDAKEELLNSFVEISEKSDFPIPQKETA